jgi:hypothetical protein
MRHVTLSSVACQVLPYFSILSYQYFERKTTPNEVRHRILIKCVKKNIWLQNIYTSQWMRKILDDFIKHFIKYFPLYSLHSYYRTTWRWSQERPKHVGVKNKRKKIYTAEQLYKCAFVGLRMNHKSTLMHSMEHKNGIQIVDKKHIHYFISPTCFGPLGHI